MQAYHISEPLFMSLRPPPQPPNEFGVDMQNALKRVKLPSTRFSAFCILACGFNHTNGFNRTNVRPRHRPYSPGSTTLIQPRRIAYTTA